MVDFRLQPFTTQTGKVSEFVGHVESDYVCPACGNPSDYCPGHGEMGDPNGYVILEMHETDNHSSCLFGDCVKTWSEARKEFDAYLDDSFGFVTVAGRDGFSTSRIMAKCDPATYRVMFNNWADSTGIEIDSLIGPVDMPNG
jgi:hypothetical protein